MRRVPCKRMSSFFPLTHSSSCGRWGHHSLGTWFLRPLSKPDGRNVLSIFRTQLPVLLARFSICFLLSGSLSNAFPHSTARFLLGVSCRKALCLFGRGVRLTVPSHRIIVPSREGSPRGSPRSARSSYSVLLHMEQRLSPRAIPYLLFGCPARSDHPAKVRGKLVRPQSIKIQAEETAHDRNKVARGTRALRARSTTTWDFHTPYTGWWQFTSDVGEARKTGHRMPCLSSYWHQDCAGM